MRKAILGSAALLCVLLTGTTSAAARGYMGHDEFAIVENSLVRRFPVYRDGDTNAAPSGGTRQIQYKLVAGESGRVLRKDRIVEY
jgi:hypothetical protein